ncbi:tRNA1(Val) (adenine(37)-N6)-methyltransferase [Prevotella melaninogenica]|uniref:tRNA1(Val) (adenine(37)-N6)-methyltransferase n=1 Tax=Prevotella melaninogenica TaxID=28132 RepID=A0A250KM37_9BACT|nr:methyltransferase [Prevotella melaninogenica]BBA28933.1 tRNA1(Val) (adenine(37)-N6)-methyltransferase [Prevotella melaninogenica]
MSFTFKQFHITDDHTAMKVGTDGVLLGAWAKGGLKILDIGTGTGLIALMMAQRFPSAQIDAIEIDKGALEDARFNVSQSPFNDRINILNISLQDYTPCSVIQEEGIYDAIVCNPPYFINSLKNPLQQRTTARHTDSLSHQELIYHSKRLLKPNGSLSIIIPSNNKDILEAEAIFNGLSILKITNIKTKSSKPAKRCLIEFGKDITTECKIEEQVLNDDMGARTMWYKNLTQAFYIK